MPISESTRVADRLFLDANVLFSAAYRENAGVSRLWDLANVTRVWSTYALAETRLNLESSEGRRRLDRLVAALEIVEALRMPPRAGLVDLPDKDLPIPAGAMAAQVTHLITGDLRHFGRFFGSRLAGIPVPTPGAYLAQR